MCLLISNIPDNYDDDDDDVIVSYYHHHPLPPLHIHSLSCLLNV